MRLDWWKWGMAALMLAVCLVLSAPVAHAQAGEPTLGQKYRTADELFERGDYAGAKKLLLEVKDTVKKENLQLNPEIEKEIEKRLTLIDQKLAEQPAAPELKPAIEQPVETPAAPAAPVMDPAKNAQLDAAKAQYNQGQALLRAGNYQAALNAFEGAKVKMDTLPIGADDKARLDANIANCKQQIALASAPKTAMTRVEQPIQVAQATTGDQGAATTATKSDAQKRFEELSSDPEVLRQKAAAEAVLKQGGGAGTVDTAVFKDAVVADDIRIQIAEREVRTKLADGDVFLMENDFERAQGKYEAARTQVKFGDFPTAFKMRWLDAIQQRIENALAQKANYGKGLNQTRDEEAVNRLQDDLLRMKRDRERQKQNLMEQWQTFINREQWEDALTVLDRVRKLDPEDKSIQPLIEQTTREQLKAWRQKSSMLRQRETAKQLGGLEEAMTPWYPLSVYPDDWKELTDRRLRAIEKTQVSEKPQDRKVQQQLKETIVTFTFQENPVMEALEFLHTLGNVNIVPDRAKFADPNQTVTLKLTNVSLETAIRLLTEQLGLKYVIRDGVVFISDDEGIKRPPETKAYDVRDLLADIPNFQGPTFELQNISSGRGGGSGGGSSSSIFSDEEDDSSEDDTAKTMEESLQDLIDLVQQVIEPGTWDEGSGNAIRGRQGSVIVTHTPDTQRRVQELLENLRATRAIQVSIDIRFITMTDNFLEAIGFDFTGTNNPAASAPHYVDTDADGVPDTSMGLEYDRTLQGGNWNFLGNALQSLGTGGELASGKGLAGTGGLSLAASFLDDVEVNFILTAVQQSRRATLMNAPKLTMMNGQRAYIAVSRQQNFVQDISVETGDAAVGYDPDIGTVQDGIVFDVRPTVSADRRYVQMDLRPSLAIVEDIQDFQVVTPGILYGGAVIQLPIISVTVVRTTVNVPDGGTLLIGGLSFAFDNELESGVPVLSKIPLIGKLFTRRGFTTERENVVILVKPTIIINEEEEAKIN